MRSMFVSAACAVLYSQAVGRAKNLSRPISWFMVREPKTQVEKNVLIKSSTSLLLRKRILSVIFTLK